MRRALLICLLAACSHPPSGPAWPKPSARETDGGESLAPHIARSVSGDASSASIDDDDDKPAASVSSPSAATPDKPADKPADAKPSFDDTIFDGGDFTIDIDD